jgi:hypothetical protein
MIGIIQSANGAKSYQPGATPHKRQLNQPGDWRANLVLRHSQSPEGAGQQSPGCSEAKPWVRAQDFTRAMQGRDRRVWISRHREDLFRPYRAHCYHITLSQGSASLHPGLSYALSERLFPRTTLKLALMGQRPRKQTRNDGRAEGPFHFNF